MPIQISGVQLGVLTGGPSSISLADLSDVNIASPLDGQYLRYNSSISEWQNAFIENDFFSYLNTNLTGSNGVSIVYSPGPDTIDISLSLTATGDASGVVADGNLPLILATVNTDIGSFGSATQIPVVTVNGKGLVTAVSTATVGNATTATTLATGRTFSTTGDATGTSAAFDGSANATIPLTLATVNAAPQADTFRKTTINGKGLVTATSAVLPADITTALGFTPVNKAGDTMTGALILNADPISAFGAVTKQYVDTIAAGLIAKPSCNTATTATLATSSAGTVTYANGTAGVGATLTTTGSFATIGGFTTANGNRVLVKDEVAQANNGIYVRTSATVLTRAVDFDNNPAGEIESGSFAYISGGTLSGTNWVQTTPSPITVGTTSIVFSQLSGPVTYAAGTGISITSNVIANTGVLSATGTANQIAVSGATGAVTFSLPSAVTISGAMTAASFSGSGASLTNVGAGTLTGTTLAANVVTSSLTNVGTLISLTSSGNVRAGVSPNGYAILGTGSPTVGGTVLFYAANGNRQGYIGNSTSTGAADTGTINYGGAVHNFFGNITMNNGQISGLTAVYSTSSIVAGGSPNGAAQINGGTPTATGSITFTAANGNRQGYIGNSTGTGAQDTGALSYVATSGHIFTGSISSTGSITATRSGVGGAELTPGSASNAGIVGFYAANGTRQGYIGAGSTTGAIDTGAISYQAPAGHNFNGGIYTNAGLTAAGSASITGSLTVSNGIIAANSDMYTYRSGGTTGVIFLNSTNNRYLYNDGSNYVLTGQGLVVSGDVTAFSDIRVKTNIEVIPDALNKVLQLRGVTFTRTDLDDTTRRHTGVIAQEVEAVLPEVVTTEVEGLEGGEGKKTVAYGNMVGLMIEAIKELNEKVDSLKAELKALKG